MKNRKNRMTPSSRRTFLQTTGLAAAGALARGSSGPFHAGYSRPWHPGSYSKPRLRPDLIDADSPPGVEVVQLTTEADVPSSHLYMEACLFHLGPQGDALHGWLQLECIMEPSPPLTIFFATPSRFIRSE